MGEAIIEVRKLVNRFGTQTVHQDLALDLVSYTHMTVPTILVLWV